ncbi:MAG: BrnT family toxin [Lachnospiraceae bacterium]|nr:BrnT family toxin [Lachnospiraceae bacterium]
MKTISFEWDEQKNKKNIAKHGISFEEASTVFCDDDALVFDDPDHSAYEERFLVIGLSFNERLCIVSHCYRDDDNVIRLISARLATKKEKKVYNDNLLR